MPFVLLPRQAESREAGFYLCLPRSMSRYTIFPHQAFPFSHRLGILSAALTCLILHTLRTTVHRSESVGPACVGSRMSVRRRPEQIPLSVTCSMLA
eukprot:6188248-Pleurochrysis_carterae.AAC.2